MIREELIPKSMKHQERIYQETLSKYTVLDDGIKSALEQFCKSAFEEKYSYIDFEQESEKFAIDTYIKLYALALICVDKVLSSRTLLTTIFKWFRGYEHTELGLFYNYILEKELTKTAKYKCYLKKLNEIPDYANKTALDSLRENERSALERFSDEYSGNTDILQVLSGKHRRFYDYHSNRILDFALFPILNINLNQVVQILSEIKNIYQVEEFLQINSIQNDLDIICNMLKFIPEITDNQGQWNPERFLLPLVSGIFYDYLYRMCSLSGSANPNADELSQDIILFLNNLKQRKDFEFFMRKLLLSLAGQIDAGNEARKQVTGKILQVIGEQILSPEPKLSRKFLEKESNKGYDKELLTALIYTTDSTKFPKEYNILFEKYILDLKNKIVISANKSYLGNEHYVLGQLFMSVENPQEEWKSLWDKLYEERRVSMILPYSENRRNISHSQYLILLGVAAVESFIYEKNTESALLLIAEVWKVLMELYLTGQYFLYQDFSYQMMSRLLLLKNMIGSNIGKEINTIKYNPELISQVIINLNHNNGNLDFICGDAEILSSLEICISEWNMSGKKRKAGYKSSYYNELEKIFNKYRTN